MTLVITTCFRPSRRAASATRSGSSSSSSSVLPLGTEQKPQGRVQTLPRIMNVAVRCDQHSRRLGHFAEEQTVSSFSSAIRSAVSAWPPPGARFCRSHGGSRREGIGGDGSTTERIGSTTTGDGDGDSPDTADDLRLARRGLEANRESGVDVRPREGEGVGKSLHKRGADVLEPHSPLHVGLD